MINWQEIARKLLPLTAQSLLDSAGPVTRLRKRQKNIAVMFVDVEQCTPLCEDLSLAEMNRVLEIYFSRYLDIVRERGGAVTEVLGDGLLALFEGSSLRKDSTRAILAALDIQESTRELNTRSQQQHDPIVVNIGINAGAELIGFTRLRGEFGERWVYRAIGPVTNIAARLCALADHGQILITGRIAELVTGRYAVRRLGPRRLKNVSGAVEVFEVLSTERKGESRLHTRERRKRNG